MSMNLASRRIRGSIVNARDPVYNSLWLAKYMNALMRHGKKAKVEQITYKAFRNLKLHNPFPPTIAPLSSMYEAMPHAGTEPPAAIAAALADALKAEGTAAAAASAAASSGSAAAAAEGAKAAAGNKADKAAVAAAAAATAFTPAGVQRIIDSAAGGGTGLAFAGGAITRSTTAPVLASSVRPVPLPYAAPHVHPLIPFYHVMQNLHMMVGTHPMNAGARTFLVPYTLDPYSQYRRPLSWLIRKVRHTRKTENAQQRMEREFRDVLKKRSSVLQQKMDLYKTVMENRAYMHYRWLY